MTTEFDISNAWLQFDAMNVPGVESNGTILQNEPVDAPNEEESYRLAEDEYNSLDCLVNGSVGNALFPKNSNTTVIAGKGVTAKMQRYHRICSLDSREYVLYMETQSYKNTLIQCNLYSPGTIDECVNTFVRVCQRLYAKRSRQMRRHVAIGCTYYNLKQTMNPSIAEMTQLFRVSRNLVIKSIKKFRLFCSTDEEMRWIFTNEIGKTNLYRFVNILGLPWSAVDIVKADMASRNAQLCNNTHVVQSIYRYMQKIVKQKKLYRYIRDKCGVD